MKYGADYLKSKNGDEVRISGRAIGGTTSITAIANSGKGWSITRTGAGVYVVKLDNPFNKLFGGGAEIVSTTLGRSCQVTAYSTSARTITFTVFDSGTKAATDLGAADEIWFEVIVGLSVMS